MKKRNGLIYLAFLVCALCACTQNDELESGKKIASGYKTTPVQLNFSTSDMTVLGAVKADTRAEKTIVRAGTKKKNIEKEEVKSDDASSMDVVIGAPQGAETRATAPATATEKKINNINIFQFSNDRLVYANYMAGDGSAVDVDLAQTGTSNTVYVVANVGQDITASYKIDAATGTTKADFLKTNFSKTATDGDLPMIGSASIDMASETALTVPLSFMVAKVVFTPTVSMDAALGKFTVTSVKLNKVPKKIYMGAISSSTNFADADIQSLDGNTTTPKTWYVPENPAGEGTSITTNTERGDYKAPKTTAMYVEVVGNFQPAGATETSQATYQVYLGDGTATDFNVARNTVYNVAATIKGINVQDGRVLIGTDLSNGGAETANCYIALAKNTYYRFDATKEGNGKDVLLTDAKVLGAANATGVSATDIKVKAIVPTSAFLVWQTAATEGGTGNVIATVGLSKRNYVVFRTGSDVEGNALIGVKDKDSAAGEVRWSWHIWKTANDPRRDAEKVEFAIRDNTTGKFATPWSTKKEISMSRNLGAANNTPKDKLAGGLLYQWGRKDPFVGSADYANASTTPLATVVPNADYAWKDGSTHGSATSAINPNTQLSGKTAEAYAIAHPTHFIIQYNGDVTYDWYAATRAAQNDNLWGNPNKYDAPSSSKPANQNRGLKSKYDPCPHGWRVAPQNTWTSFTKTDGANIGGNNYGTGSGAWKTWNVTSNVNPAGTDDAAKLATVQKSFTDNKGWTFYCQEDSKGTTVYFPASGYRDRTDGGFRDIGVSGYSWSSSSAGVGSSNVSYLRFDSGNVNPYYLYNRGWGLQVRCVQE